MKTAAAKPAAVVVEKGETVAPEKANPGLMAELERLRAENEALRAREAKSATITLQWSVNGYLSVYGLGRFPVTLAGDQWERFLTPEIITALLQSVTDGKASGIARIKGEKDHEYDARIVRLGLITAEGQAKRRADSEKRKPKAD